MNKTTFTYDDVRVALDCQIRMNSHPQWELSCVICGRGVTIIGDKEETGLSITFRSLDYS